MSEKEIREQAQSCFVCKNGNAVLTNPENKDEVHEFGFDLVYGTDTEQRIVYEDFGRPVLERAFGGYNGTIFAYGQTGSGKTFSMTGIHGNESLEGLIPRMNKSLFEKIQMEKANDPNKLFLVECSFFEIYNEIIYDLLDSSSAKDKKNKGLEIKEHSVLGIYVKDLQERVVESREEVIELMALGASNRTVGYTNMNSESSRSHSIFVIKIHQKDSSDESKNVFAKVNLVDLAGSERAAGTGAVGSRLKEGANINKSLSALGNVINALVEDARTGKKSFIPYRNSKLTRVLQESLGGNSLCSMLATLSPANINFVETLGTLKYASRAKSIKVNAKKNEEASQISQLSEEIAALKKKLSEQAESGLDPREKNEIVAKYEKQIQEIDAVRMQTWEDKARLSKQHEMERKKLAKERARADQKTQEEKVKKWKLLEAKADIELAIRATRELDVGDDAWISMTTKVKVRVFESMWPPQVDMQALDQDVKDARTLICVFKDSFDKDVASWKAMQQSADEPDDASAGHTTASQLCTKIKNIQEESAKMMALESELLRQTSALIDSVCDEAEKLSSTPAPTAKEQKQLLEDRDKALAITRAMVRTYRTALVTTLKAERKRILNVRESDYRYPTSFTDASMVMLAELQTQIDSPHVDEDRKKPRVLATKSLAKAVETCSKLVATMPSVDAPRIQIPKGELHAFGVETKIIGDDKLTASSGDAKQARLNGQTCWIATAEDAAPWLKVDLGSVKFVDSFQLQGGIVGGSTVLSEMPLVLTKANMESIAKQYDPASVTGDHQQTYDIAKHVLSWVGLLKTTQVPTKLFSRPPVRFLHDVISLVVSNTGYGAGLFTEKEKDYTQLTEKKDKADYLVKVLQLVASSFQGTVEIKATDANILAGKEPEHTMQFLALFCLGAIRHLATTLPATTQDGVPAMVTPQPVEAPQAWVTELDVAVSVDGDTWTKPLPSGSANASTDVFTAVSTKLPQPTVARFVKFIPTKWNVAAAIRCEVLGFKLTEKDESLAQVQDEVVHYLGLLTTLFSAGELILDEARIKWKKAKDMQREKQTELKNMDAWKHQVAALKSDMDMANNALEKSKADKLDMDKLLATTNAKLDAAASTCTLLEDQNKKTRASLETITAQLSDTTKEAASWKQQHGQVTEHLKSMSQSKADLEKLVETLRSQLTSKSASDGLTDSKMATLSADLQATLIQLDEAKRTLQQSDKALADGQAERDALQTQLSQARAALAAKDEAVEALESKHKSQMTDSSTQLDVVQSALTEAVNKQRDLDAQLQKAVASAATMQTELEQAKKREVDSNQIEVKRLHDEAVESEKRVFQLQAQQVRLQADNERLEAKYASVEDKVKGLEAKQVEYIQELETLQRERKQLIEQEEELQLQLQVVTDERDSARQKEEQLFVENAEKEQEIERIRDGYVWVTDRMNNKEDELAELQDQVEKYQSLLKLAGERPSTASSSTPTTDQFAGLYKAAFGKDVDGGAKPSDIKNQLLQWILDQKENRPTKDTDQSKQSSAATGRATNAPQSSQGQPAMTTNDANAPARPEPNPHVACTPLPDAKPSAKVAAPPKESSPDMSSAVRSSLEVEESMPHGARDPKGPSMSAGIVATHPPQKAAHPPATSAREDTDAKMHHRPASSDDAKPNPPKQAGTPTATDTSRPAEGSASGGRGKIESNARQESIDDLVPAMDTSMTNGGMESTEVAEVNEYDDDFDADDDENPVRRGKSKRRSVDKSAAPIEPVSAKTIAQNAPSGVAPTAPAKK
ncbi:hypothetical protein H310_02917 [Aphanomyces invadans]|uniref:Kinesin motor domain-containing protein n=1 Tax=Aphanomyces invadans TaxID=157072 RepID=A0A024UKN8_9STRA|nr:hypothetical protein H310_02917 [Aphanomyces invadans]ETW06755.1 hypothetical protein H310_02917 [Aphanomyces invadans]|eukprot:XP_008864830.1 hypothetical protein H310_02917 [Aphanomyces invadans]